jgi:hypothetical protein
MRKLTLFILLECLVIAGGSSGFAAPIRPVGPVNVTGTISEVQWVPEKTVQGLPRLSGSAGRDRVVSPHFLIRLVDYEGVSSEVAITMTRYLDRSAYGDQNLKARPSFILLKIDYGDRDYLKKGMRITVTGYKVAGDEGGTWTTFTGIEILQRSSSGDPFGNHLQRTDRQVRLTVSFHEDPRTAPRPGSTGGVSEAH